MFRHLFGLTLLELLISLAIVSILLATAIPGIRDYQMNLQIKSASALVFSDLKSSRSQAIINNTWTIACPGNVQDGCNNTANWHEGWLVFADQNGDQIRQTGEPVLRQANRLEHLTATGASSKPLIRFFPGGTAVGSNSSIVFCDDRGVDKGRKIVISNSGRIRISKLSNSETSRCPLA